MPKSKDKSIVVAYASPMHDATGRGAELRELSKSLIRKGYVVFALSMGKKADAIVEKVGHSEYLERVVEADRLVRLVKPLAADLAYSSYLWGVAQEFIAHRYLYNSNRAMSEALKEFKPDVIITTNICPEGLDVLDIVVGHRQSYQNAKIVVLNGDFRDPGQFLDAAISDFTRQHGDLAKKGLMDPKEIEDYFERHIERIYDMVLMNADAIVFNKDDDIVYATERISVCSRNISERLARFDLDEFRGFPNLTEERFSAAKSGFAGFMQGELAMKFSFIPKPIDKDKFEALISGLVGITD